MAYLNCPWCPAQAFLREVHRATCSPTLEKYICPSNHKFYVESEETLNIITHEDYEGVCQTITLETPEKALMKEVEAELARARILFKPIHSPHEALGIVMEEFDEFKNEVYAFNLGKGRDTRPAMRKELIQLATMALRTVLDALEFDPTAEV